MSDLATLKEDLDTMIYYKKWLDAIFKKLEEELGERWFSGCEDPLKGAIGKLEWMIEECKDEIDMEERMLA